VTASIWASGKVTTTGSTSEDNARMSCRKVARCLQRLGFKVRFTHFRVVNVLGTCAFPFGIRVPQFSQANAREVCYEPELHPGATYRIMEPSRRATLKLFSTGSVTVTAPSVPNVQAAIEHVYPLVYEFRVDRSGVISSDEKSYSHAVATSAASNYPSVAVVQKRDRKRKCAVMVGVDSDDSNSSDSAPD